MTMRWQSGGKIRDEFFVASIWLLLDDTRDFSQEVFKIRAFVLLAQFEILLCGRDMFVR